MSNNDADPSPVRRRYYSPWLPVLTTAALVLVAGTVWAINALGPASNIVGIVADVPATITVREPSPELTTDPATPEVLASATTTVAPQGGSPRTVTSRPAPGRSTPSPSVKNTAKPTKPTVTPSVATVTATADDGHSGPAERRKVNISVDVTPASTGSPRVSVSVVWLADGLSVGTDARTFTGSGHFEATVPHDYATCGVPLSARVTVSAVDTQYTGQQINVSFPGYVCTAAAT